MHPAHAICIVLLIIIIGTFLVLAFSSNLLRDTIDDPAAFMANLPPKYKNKTFDKIPKPFSLARTQLAVWTTIISCVYVFLYFWVGCDSMTVNQTALVLLGLSAATTAAGSVIDNSQAQANAAATTTAVAVAAPPPPPPAAADAADAAAAPAATPATPVAATVITSGPVRHQNAPSQGFLMDLVSDGDGVNIHRFQNVVWTGIAMIVYLYMALRTQHIGGCGLPVLDPTLLSISGISNATYVGLKINENSQ